MLSPKMEALRWNSAYTDTTCSVFALTCLSAGKQGTQVPNTTGSKESRSLSGKISEKQRHIKWLKNATLEKKHELGGVLAGSIC